VFVEVSAGNDGPLCYTLDSPPAIYDEVYTTGAVDEFGQVTAFSSVGPVNSDGSGRIKPDIIAPGEEVLSAMPGSTYGRMTGTSMAGPHVVGVVALMWSANPDLIGDIDRTEAILNASARPYTGPVPQCPGADGLPSTVTGYGVLDAYAAVQMALETP
jgi:subtilisin family serine protease